MQDEKTAYSHYLGQRSDWLGLSPETPTNQMVTRIGAMLRLVTPEAGAALTRCFDGLGTTEQRRALRFLSAEAADRLPRTPTYMTAVLVNPYNNPGLGGTPEERMMDVFRIGIPFITTVLETFDSMISEGRTDGRNPLNFNAIAAYAAHAPNSLGRSPYIDPITSEVTIRQ